MYLALRAFQDLNWHSRNTIHVTESSQKIITFESMKSARADVGEILAQSRVSRHTAHVASGVPPGGGRERGVYASRAFLRKTSTKLLAGIASRATSSRPYFASATPAIAVEQRTPQDAS